MEQCQGTVDVETTVYCQMVEAGIAEEKSRLVDDLLSSALSTIDAVETSAAAAAAARLDAKSPAAIEQDEAEAVPMDVT